jgi:hypothetical protein
MTELIVWSTWAKRELVPKLNTKPLDWAQNEVACEPEAVIERGSDE